MRAAGAPAAFDHTGAAVRWSIPVVVVMLVAILWLFQPVHPALALEIDPMSAKLLAPCPKSPNCVSSQSADSDHRVDPLRYEGPSEAAWEALRVALVALPRSRIVEECEGWLRAEFRSPVFGFVDDLEARLDVANRVIHLRSASRTGYWDLGVNRKRVERLRTRFAEAFNRGR